MEDIYYVDRPSIPATQQNIIHLESIIEHAILVDAVDISLNYSAHAVEVRSSDGEIDGTLLYFPGATHAMLTSVVESSGGEEDEEEAEAEVFDGEEVGVDELTDTPQTLDEFNAESKLIDLELELSEAVHHVQELEDEIAAIEKGAFID